MRVDFYQLSRDPAELVVPALAENTLKAGQRMLVVSADPAQLERVSQALWAQKPGGFLAHGLASDAHPQRQPILLSQRPEPVNRASFILFADGQWRGEATRFERVFLLFGEATVHAARGVWRDLGQTEGAERHFWKQDGGRWREGP